MISKGKKIRLLLAVETELFRHGLAAQFEEIPEIELICEVSTGHEALDKAVEMRPDVILTELILPMLDGISVCRRIHTLLPAIEVVFLSSVHTEDQMRQAFEVGGRAYLSKSCGFEELVFAIKKAASGDYYLSGPAGIDMVAEYVKPLLQTQRPGGLMTDREREMARLLADGYSTKESAAIMNISPKTAETHRGSIMKKLGAKNVTDVVKYCIRNHLIEP